MKVKLFLLVKSPDARKMVVFTAAKGKEGSPKAAIRESDRPMRSSGEIQV